LITERLRALVSFAYRISAFPNPLLAIAIPLEPIPVVDALYDIGVPAALIWYWFKFFRDARRITQPNQRQVSREGR